MYLKNVLFTFIIVTGFFGASELILASIGVSPALLTKDPFVGFAENVPQFVEATGPDGSIILKTANNKKKAATLTAYFAWGDRPHTVDPMATGYRFAVGCASI